MAPTASLYYLFLQTHTELSIVAIHPEAVGLFHSGQQEKHRGTNILVIAHFYLTLFYHATSVRSRSVFQERLENKKHSELDNQHIRTKYLKPDNQNLA